ncbi:MAG TPA: hypothetical protein VF399_10535 [bacterium]
MSLLATFLICAFLNEPGDTQADSIFDTGAVEPAAIGRENALSDPWFGQDKLMHFYASAGICGSSFYLFKYHFDRDVGEGTIYSVSVTGLIGLGKETYDLIKGRHFSVKDLFWDAAGIAAGYFIFMHQY